MTESPTVELDLREVPETERNAKTLELFDRLAVGAAFVLVGDGDPKPIHEALADQRPEVLGWSFLPPEENGWRARLTRLPARDEETTVGRFFERDHDEIDVLLHFLRHYLKKAVEGDEAAVDAARGSFREFDRRLERHIRWEEEILFAAVERQVPDLTEGPGRVMRAEHKEIRILKSDLEGLFGSNDISPQALAEARRAVDALVAVLYEHNGKEEQVYYPMSDEIFSPKETARLLAEIRALD